MSTAVSTETKKYLSFTMGLDLFAIDVKQVHEVLEMMPVSRIPKMPAYMRGIINIRGSVVPVIDLRNMLGISSVESAVDTCIIVIQLVSSSHNTRVGLIVDGAREVIRFSGEEIEEAPRFGTSLSGEFIEGIGKIQEEFVVLLNVDMILTGHEIDVISPDTNL